MHPDRDAGSILLVGLPGPDLGAEDARALRGLRPGGVILFRRNLDDPARLERLWADLAGILDDPWLLAVDQEGGRVSRLEPWIGPTPSAARIGAAGAEHAFDFGRATGKAVAALGFDLDFAPVVDLCPPGTPNGIGDRAYATDPVLVTHVAGSFLDGLQRAGVAGCVKHFPGLGDTAVDSHVALPTVNRGADRLHELDLAPYRVLGRRPAAVMVGHGHYPALGMGPRTPASLAPEVVADLLRGQLGFDGLVVSDDLEMGAVAPLDIDGRAAVAAISCGCDLLPYCADLDRAAAAHAAVVAAARESERFAERLHDAARRVRRTAARWPVRRPDIAAFEDATRQLARVVAAIDRAAPPEA